MGNVSRTRHIQIQNIELEFIDFFNEVRFLNECTEEPMPTDVVGSWCFERSKQVMCTNARLLMNAIGR